MITTMKILFEVPDKSVDLAKFALISACDTEEEECHIEQLCEILGEEGADHGDKGGVEEDRTEGVLRLHGAEAGHDPGGHGASR